MDYSLEISKCIAKNTGGAIYCDGMFYKLINGEWIGKQAVQCRRKEGTTYMTWLEGCDKSEIDLRYYDKEGNRN